jgi:F-type H+-transporting ATPase subunit delta
MSQTITKRYAQALFKLSQEFNKIETVRNDIKTILGLIASSSHLEEFLQSPILPFQKRHDIINRILKKGFDKLTHQFVLLLNEKNRLSRLKDICEAFEQMYLVEKGILKVTIASSVALNNRQANEIVKHLRSKLGKEIEPHTFVDPTLIGGIKIQQGDTIFDYSFNAQLERFRKNLIKA